MNFSEIKELMAAFSQSNITNLKIENKEISLSLAKENKEVQILTPQPKTETQITTAPITTPITTEPQPQNIPTEKTTATPIKAPLVGIFYTSPSPDKPPFVQKGEKVNKGDVVGLIEAMKMMSEIKSEVTGTVKNIAVTNEAMVAFGDIIMEIEA
ncbi:MAG: acetyl-CoA carboxylase biotin carboxyl carrier protein [Clostridiales bacterium]